MEVIYAREELPDYLPNSLFLVGPTPRSELVPSWRPEALRLLGERAFTGTVLIPEDRPDADGKVRYRGNYNDQVAWETEGLRKSTAILAWVPRDLDSMPAFTTNTEFGLWADSGKMVFGAPLDAPKNTYLRWHAEQAGISSSETLPDTVDAALELLGQFEAQGKDCVFCDIVREDPLRQIEAVFDHSVQLTPHHPIVPGHKLFIPRVHTASAADNPGVASGVFHDAAEYIRRQEIQANIISSIGSDATQTVFHLHVHVVPRVSGDDLALPWTDQIR